MELQNLKDWGVPETSDRCKLQLSDKDEGNDKQIRKALWRGISAGRSQDAAKRRTVDRSIKPRARRIDLEASSVE